MRPTYSPSVSQDQFWAEFTHNLNPPSRSTSYSRQLLSRSPPPPRPHTSARLTPPSRSSTTFTPLLTDFAFMTRTVIRKDEMFVVLQTKRYDMTTCQLSRSPLPPPPHPQQAKTAAGRTTATKRQKQLQRRKEVVT